MAKKYRPVDRDQPFLLPPDMREWLPADHPVWLVITVVEDHLDTSAFHAGRKTGGAGTAGYDPDMLAAVLVWAYAHGVASSREIERLCGTDVAFRVICAGNVPDHVTFARFRGDFPGAVAGFFAQVLVLCARLGMGRLGMVALDGMKIESPRVLWRLPIHGRVGRWEQHGSIRTSCVTGRSGWCWTWSRIRRPA